MSRMNLQGRYTKQSGAVLIAVAMALPGLGGLSEAAETNTPKLTRKEAALLIAEASYGHNACNQYIISPVEVNREIDRSGFTEEMKQSEKDAIIAKSRYEDLLRGNVEMNCLDLYGKYGENGTVVRGIFRKK